VAAAELSAVRSAYHYLMYSSPPFFSRYDQKCLYFWGCFLTCISNVHTTAIL